MHLEKRLEFNGHSGAIYTLDIQDNFIFSGSGDKIVAKWNLTTGTQENFSIQCEQAIYCLKLVNGKRQLAVGTSSGALHIIDLIQKAEIKHFINHQSGIFEIEENSLKAQIYTTDADGNLAIWDSGTWDLLMFLPLELGKIRNIYVAESGNVIYLSCQDGSIRKFDTENFNELLNFKAHKDGCNAILLSQHQGFDLMSAGKDGYIRLWKLDESPTCVKEIPAHNYGIYGLKWLSRNEYFVSISRDKSIKLWETKTMTVIQKIERKDGGHSHAVNSIAKVNEANFVTVGDDKRVIYWGLKE